VGLCGRAEVYRAMGNLDAARRDYRLAIERSPFTSIPISGLIDVLREQGDLRTALQLAIEGAQRFPMEIRFLLARASILRQQAKDVEALGVYDDIIHKFPFDNFSRLARAEVLRRMGNNEEALKAYNDILERRVNFTQARLAKATLLVQLGQFREAEDLLPKGPIRSQADWSFQLVAAFIAAGKKEFLKSLQILRHGSERAPFAKQRRLFRAAWAQNELDKGRASVALRVVEAAPHDITNVIRLHALAASGRTELAKETLNQIISLDGTERIRELSTEIARKFRIIEGGATRSRDWIFEAEKQEMLFESASLMSRVDLAA
jgi:tetratricopeptide (TPR) repeat protein